MLYDLLVQSVLKTIYNTTITIQIKRRAIKCNDQTNNIITRFCPPCDLAMVGGYLLSSFVPTVNCEWGGIGVSNLVRSMSLVGAQGVSCVLACWICNCLVVVLGLQVSVLMFLFSFRPFPCALNVISLLLASIASVWFDPFWISCPTFWCRFGVSVGFNFIRACVAAVLGMAVSRAHNLLRPSRVGVGLRRVQ